MQAILKEARKIAEQLIDAKPLFYSTLKVIPRTQGVYLVYDKAGTVIYVGKGKILRSEDRTSDEVQITTSTFRRKLSKAHNLQPGEEMKRWIIDNCSFAWADVSDRDKAGLVETLLIAYLRTQKSIANLLNE